jgi:hypothetical protein
MFFLGELNLFFGDLFYIAKAKSEIQVLTEYQQQTDSWLSAAHPTSTEYTAQRQPNIALFQYLSRCFFHNPNLETVMVQKVGCQRLQGHKGRLLRQLQMPRRVNTHQSKNDVYIPSTMKSV